MALNQTLKSVRSQFQALAAAAKNQRESAAELCMLTSRLATERAQSEKDRSAGLDDLTTAVAQTNAKTAAGQKAVGNSLAGLAVAGACTRDTIGREALATQKATGTLGQHLAEGLEAVHGALDAYAAELEIADRQRSSQAERERAIAEGFVQRAIASTGLLGKAAEAAHGMAQIAAARVARQQEQEAIQTTRQTARALQSAQPDAAVQWARQATALSGDVRARLNLASAFYEAGQVEECRAALAQLDVPQAAEACILQALQCWRAGDASTARTWADRAMAATPDEPRLKTIVATLAFADGAAATALRQMQVGNSTVFDAPVPAVGIADRVERRCTTVPEPPPNGLRNIETHG